MRGIRITSAEAAVVGSTPLLVIVSIIDGRWTLQEQSPLNSQFKYPMKSLYDWERRDEDPLLFSIRKTSSVEEKL